MHIIQVECMFVDMKQSTDVVVLLNLELFPPRLQGLSSRPSTKKRRSISVRSSKGILSWRPVGLGLNRDKLNVFDEFRSRRAERDTVDVESVVVKQRCVTLSQSHFKLL